jgi:ankyrin repeat protein
MRLLVERGGLKSERFHQTLEHTLEPHQRSGEPFYPIAELLVRRSGVDLNDRGNQGRTLLHGAANRGTLKAVRWLLEHGADPNALDEHGRSPLHVCARRNTSTSVVRLLIEAGSDIGARDASGNTALDYAVENKRVKVVAFLAAAGAQ